VFEKRRSVAWILSKLEGKAANLRGDVFELAVGYYYSQHAQYIEINKNILEYGSGKKKEIDVFVKFSNKELRIVECKGYKYPLDDVFVSKWLSNNVPIIRKWILDQDEYINKSITFELWATGSFTDVAREMLEKASKQTKKIQLNILGKVIYYPNLPKMEIKTLRE
jgi:hypothetical protein